MKKLIKLFRAIEGILTSPLMRFANYMRLKKTNFSITFKHEGGFVVKLPTVSLLGALLNKSKDFNRNVSYMSRPNAEVLLRKIVFEMYKTKYINDNLSIIDIGSWISDNSIVWASYLSGDGNVLAIDPSIDNLNYSRNLAEINNVKNINFIESVCSEKIGIKLDFDGTIDHAVFQKSSSGSGIESSTIDKIVNDNNAKLGLIHVDVEGFELSVLKGAESSIKRDMPIISFEQHISREDVYMVSKYLESLDYKVYMINEVLPFCDKDCRNFLAFPSNRDLPQLTKYKQSELHKFGICSAVVGQSLIEI